MAVDEIANEDWSGSVISAKLRGRIRWADADALGRLHFPRMFEYFEDGETELLHSVGFHLHRDALGYDFPRVHVDCRFRRVLPLSAPFFMLITIGKLGNTSIRYDYQVFADDAHTELALEGSMTVVAVQDGKPVAIPENLRKALSEAHS